MGGHVAKGVLGNSGGVDWRLCSVLAPDKNSPDRFWGLYVFMVHFKD